MILLINNYIPVSDYVWIILAPLDKLAGAGCAKRSLCAYFCDSEQEDRTVTKKAAKPEKVLKKDAITLIKSS